jgi:zinc protease
VSAARGRSEHAGPQRFTVGSGAPVYVETDTKVPLVHITVSFKSGSFYDPPEKDGTARMMLRLLRRGADGLGAQEIERKVDALGAELSVEASTSSVSVQGTVIRRNLAPFGALLGRVLGRPAFASDELERLRRESVAELEEARDNDRHLAQVAFRRAVFGDHAFGRGSTGRIASVKKIARDDIVASYTRHLSAGNAVFGFAGDIDEKTARALSEELAGTLGASAKTPDVIPEPNVAPGRRLFFVDKPERTQTQIIIGGLGTHPRDPDHIALASAVAVFGGTFTSRLMKEVRSKRGWSYGASARIAIERARHAFQMWTFPAAEDAAACVELELSLLEKLLQDGITERETAFIKRYLTRSHAFDVDTPSKRLQQALDVELLDLPADYHSAYLKRVADVTAASATDAVRARLTKDDLTIAMVGTASGLLDAVRAKIAGLANATTLPFDAE